MQSCIFWSLLGMVGHSFTTLFVNLAERSTAVSNYMVLVVSTWNKIVGLAAAVLGVVLISIRERGRPETLSEFSPLICHCQSCIVTTDAEESRALETGSGGGASHLISKRYIARRTQPEVARSLLFISRTCRCRYPNLDRCALQSRPTRVILASLVIQPKEGDVDEQDRLPDRGA
jgi:hypothetical protein